MKTICSLAAILALMAFAGCGDDSVSTRTPDGHGVLSVAITDGPIDANEIKNLFVSFEALFAVPAADSADTSTAPVGVNLISAPITLDLLTLTNGLTADLGLATLPEGDYRAIILVLDEGGAWLIDANGDSHDVKVPSGRIRIITDFTVSDGQVTEIVLDFDASASLHRAGNSGMYILRPVIRQMPDRPEAATIEGDVFVQTAEGLVSAGDYMVPNPRFGRPPMDHGNGRRPRDSRGRQPDNDTARRMVPLTVAWPMFVHAAVVGDDDDPPGDDGSARGGVGALDEGSDMHPGRPHPRGTLVMPDGHYKLWRLRKGGTYNLRLFVHPRSGFEIVSGPGQIELTGDLADQDFVIQLRETPPAP